MNVTELLEAVRHEGQVMVGYRGERGRYIAIERITRDKYESYIDEDGDEQYRSVGPVSGFHIYGGSHIYTYKTLRHARRAAGEHGFVCVLDISQLLVVDLDAVAAGVDDKNELDEYSLAERQLEAWANRVRDLKEKQSK